MEALSVPELLFFAVIIIHIHASLDQLKSRRLVAVILLASGLPLVLR